MLLFGCAERSATELISSSESIECSTNHLYVHAEVKDDPTLETEGRLVFLCDDCKNVIETVIMPALETDEYIKDEVDGCENGRIYFDKEFRCSITKCIYRYRTSIDIPGLGHTFDDDHDLCQRCGLVDKKGLIYRVEDHGLFVTGYEGDSTSLTISARVDDQIVYGIDKFCVNNTKLKTVEVYIPDGLGSFFYIQNSFYASNSLESVKFYNENAFATGLIQIYVSLSFAYCDSLSVVSLSSNMEFRISDVIDLVYSASSGENEDELSKKFRDSRSVSFTNCKSLVEVGLLCYADCYEVELPGSLEEACFTKIGTRLKSTGLKRIFIGASDSYMESYLEYYNSLFMAGLGVSDFSDANYNDNYGYFEECKALQSIWISYKNHDHYGYDIKYDDWTFDGCSNVTIYTDISQNSQIGISLLEQVEKKVKNVVFDVSYDDAKNMK